MIRFAYVDFATPELQKIAIDLSESFFEGRKLLIKSGRSRCCGGDARLTVGDDHVVKPDAITPRPEKAKIRLEPGSAAILKKQIHKESATLFVGNLPFDATEEALRDMIEENATEASGSNAVATPVEAKTEIAGEDVDQEEEGESKEKAEYIDKRGGKVAGLRKVRLGAFEDTGRCKG